MANQMIKETGVTYTYTQPAYRTYDGAWTIPDTTITVPSASASAQLVANAQNAALRNADIAPVNGGHGYRHICGTTGWAPSHEEAADMRDSHLGWCR